MDADKLIRLSLVITLAPTAEDPRAHLLAHPIDLAEAVADFLQAYPMLPDSSDDGGSAFMLSSLKPAVAFLYNPTFTSVPGYIEQHRYEAVADHLLAVNGDKLLFSAAQKHGWYPLCTRGCLSVCQFVRHRFSLPFTSDAVVPGGKSDREVLIAFLSALETISQRDKSEVKGYFTVIDLLFYISFTWLSPPHTRKIAKSVQRFRNGELKELFLGGHHHKCKVTPPGVGAHDKHRVEVKSPAFLGSTFSAKIVHRPEVYSPSFALLSTRFTHHRDML